MIENSVIEEISESKTIFSSLNTANFFISEDTIITNSNDYEAIVITSLDDYFSDKKIDLIKMILRVTK